MTLRFREHRAAWLILAAYVVLATTYSVVTPVFEGPDEFLHAGVVHYITETGQVPVQQPGVRTAWDQEGSQPPLYYALAAALTVPLDTSDFESVHRRNPHGKYGLPFDRDNKNIALHNPQAERFPWRGAVLSVHLVRFMSVAFGAGTVALTYTLARTHWPDQQSVALLAMALVAFNPMFLFVSGTVSNDNLLVMLSTAALVLMVAVLRGGLTTLRAGALALTLALAALTKLSGLTLLPVAALVLAIHARHRADWRRALLAGAGIVAALLAVTGWWFARNLRLYGELTGLQTMIAIAGLREDATLAAVASEWPGFWRGYWAYFGSSSILAEPIVYHLFTVLSLAALAGFVAWAAREAYRRRWATLLIPGVLALQAAVTFAALVRWSLLTYGSQGRLMFPVIAATSTLMAYGLLVWLPVRWQGTGAAAVAAPLLLVAALSPFRYIAPAYSPPAAVSAVPESAHPAAAAFGGLEVVAAAVGEPERDRLPVTLYLRASEPLAEDMSLYLRVLGPDGAELGQLKTYPGGGLLPTSQMQQGALYADAYSLRFAGPPDDLRLAVQAGVLSGNEFVLFPATLPGGGQAAALLVSGERLTFEPSDPEPAVNTP